MYNKKPQITVLTGYLGLKLMAGFEPATSSLPTNQEGKYRFISYHILKDCFYNKPFNIEIPYHNLIYRFMLQFLMPVAVYVAVFKAEI